MRRVACSFGARNGAPFFVVVCHLLAGCGCARCRSVPFAHFCGGALVPSLRAAVGPVFKRGGLSKSPVCRGTDGTDASLPVLAAVRRREGCSFAPGPCGLAALLVLCCGDARFQKGKGQCTKNAKKGKKAVSGQSVRQKDGNKESFCAFLRV